MADKRDIPFRPGIGLALIAVGVLIGVIGTVLKYQDIRNTGDSSWLSAGTWLVALAGAAVFLGFKMRKRPDA